MKIAAIVIGLQLQIVALYNPAALWSGFDRVPLYFGFALVVYATARLIQEDL